MAVEGTTQDVSTLRNYLRVVRRRKWIILQAVILVPLAAVVLSLRQQPLYSASADVYLSQQDVGASILGIPNSSFWQSPERIAATQADLARSPEVAKRVLEAAGVTDRTPQQFLWASSVTPKPDSDLLWFGVTDTNPGLAVKLANAYANEFSRFKGEFDAQAYRQARENAEGKMNELEAAGQADSPLYQELVRSVQQLRQIETLQGRNAVPVNPAESAIQIQPTPVRDGILGLLLGLLLGIGLALLRETLDTRLRSAEEIGDRLGLPLLARLAEPPRRLRSKDRLVTLDDPHSVQAEAFRMLRTNLDFVNLDRRARTIMITSALQAEGKSTTAANLAVAMARAGRRIILVDLDLRRPFLDRFFGLEGQPGLTQVALGHVSLEEAITPVAISGRDHGVAVSNGNGAARVEGTLEILPSGPIPPNPGEFVGSHKLVEILEELRGRADVVLLDAPPVLHVGDAMTLSARVDALIVVTRLNVVRRPMLNELRRMLESSPADKLGFVMTGADLEDGYGYAYGSKYYQPHTKTERTREPVA